MKIEDFFDDMPSLETERLILRKLKIEDADDIFEYAHTSTTTQFLTWYAHRAKTDTLRYLESVIENYKKGYIAPWGIELKESGRIIGTIGFSNLNVINKRAEFGLVIGEKDWNKGYASEAAKAMLKFGFAELHLHRIEAHCDENNLSSQRVLEKIGLFYEGTLRDRYILKDKYVSVKLYSMLQNEFVDSGLAVDKK